MDNYTNELKRILKLSEIIALNNNDKEINSIHFIKAILESKNNIRNTLKENNIIIDLPKNNNKINYIPYYSKELLKAIDKSIDDNNYNEEITLEDVTINLLNSSNKVTKLLENNNININNIIENININTNNLYINEIGINLNKKVNNDIIYGRDKEINEIIEILARKNKNNPLLIGEAGVGKTAIVEELARRINNKNVPDFLKRTTIYSLSLSTLIAGTKYRGEFEEKLNRVIKELEGSKNIILFIDEIHSLVGAGGAEGAIDASNILKPSMSRGNIRIIGATTIKEYKLSIEKDKALDRRFQKIIVNEPNKEETKNILLKIKNNYEKYHNVIIKDNIIYELIDLTSKYIKYKYEPDRSIEVLDELCAKAKINNNDNKNISNKLIELKNKKNQYILNNNYKQAYEIKKEILELENHKNKNTIIDKDLLINVIENKINCKLYKYKNNNYLDKLNNISKDNKIINKLKNITRDLFNNNSNTPIVYYNNIDIEITIKEYSKLYNLNYINIDINNYPNNFLINKILGYNNDYINYYKKSIFEDIKYYPISVIYLNNIDDANIELKDIINNILNKGYLILNNDDIIYFNNCLFVIKTKSNITNIGFINYENKVNN